VLLAFVLAISWLSAAFGVLAKTPEAAGGMTFFMMFVPYASSAFVPIDTMPSWLHGFARHQPVTPVIETLRGLLLDRPVGDAPAHALAWCGGILLVSVALACGLLPPPYALTGP
jgi:ABC-2 type transport system permease protein